MFSLKMNDHLSFIKILKIYKILNERIIFHLYIKKI